VVEDLTVDMLDGSQVLRIDKSGKTNKVYIKRRDLLRRNRLLPRDLRRIDPSLSVVKTSPSINIKDHALLMNVGGVRCAPARCRCHHDVLRRATVCLAAVTQSCIQHPWI
jgi:hypothetical protein